MAKITLEVIHALRATASELEASHLYQWGHMGSCNCGFLAQQITHLNKKEIHQRAMMRYGDWNEQLNDYCPTSGLPFDELISELLTAGFSIEDLKQLETLSDPEILAIVPGGQYLKHNLKADVVKYLRNWAQLIEQKLLLQIQLPQFQPILVAERYREIFLLAGE